MYQIIYNMPMFGFFHLDWSFLCRTSPSAVQRSCFYASDSYSCRNPLDGIYPVMFDLGSGSSKSSRVLYKGLSDLVQAQYTTYE